MVLNRRRSNHEDFVRYEQLLQETRDDNGVLNSNEAVQRLADELAADPYRAREFAQSHAAELRKKFDKQRQPETNSGQLVIHEDSYLVLGDSERVKVTDATAVHTGQWIDIQRQNYESQRSAWETKERRAKHLLDVQRERNCSMWDAELILKGESP